jgi:adenosylmethionine-8-amino-7-oxononanoate aminotransferase
MTSLVYPTTNLTQIEQLTIVRGDGIYVYDQHGQRYLEGLAALWCSALGYGNQELIEAITAQLRTLPYSHMFGGRTHQVAMELADRLSEMVPLDQARIFFANSGSEANDSQIKMLHYYFNVIGKPEKKKIITLDRSYHGVTVASAALTSLPAMHTHFDIPVEALGILRAETPHYYHGHREGESEQDYVDRLLVDLRQLIEQQGPETIAAFVAEPIGGASGVVVAPDSYFPALEKLLAEYDILFWADEVICGFGRTGNDFGCNLCLHPYQRCADSRLHVPGHAGTQLPGGRVRSRLYLHRPPGSLRRSPESRRDLPAGQTVRTRRRGRQLHAAAVAGIQRPSAGR